LTTRAIISNTNHLWTPYSLGYPPINEKIWLELREEIEGIVSQLNAFFDGSDGAIFGRELLAEPPIICLDPSEDRLLERHGQKKPPRTLELEDIPARQSRASSS
jgi:hypothetical protein